MDALTLGLFGGVLVLLGIATAIVRYLKRRVDLGLDPAIIETFRLRVWAWWLLFAPLAGSTSGRKALLTDHTLHGDFLLGPPRVHHPDPNAASRPPCTVLGVLHLHAAAIRAS